MNVGPPLFPFFSLPLPPHAAAPKSIENFPPSSHARESHVTAGGLHATTTKHPRANFNKRRTTAPKAGTSLRGSHPQASTSYNTIV